VIDRIAAKVHARDTFILFAAAHGKSEAGRFQLILRTKRRRRSKGAGPTRHHVSRPFSAISCQTWTRNYWVLA
jgi:hypothetical protein